MLYYFCAVILISHILGYTSPQFCTQKGEYYQYLIHQCQSCPKNTKLKDTVYCNCTSEYYPNPDVVGFKVQNACILIDGFETISIYNVDGSFHPQAINCSFAAYANTQNTACIPCGSNQNYSTMTNTCQCNSGYIEINGICYKQSATTQQKAITGCQNYSIKQSCQQLLNLCVNDNYIGSNCQKYQKLQSNHSYIPTYKFSPKPNDSINIFASSLEGINSTTVKNTLQFQVIEYLLNGTVNDIKYMDQNLFGCPLTDQGIINFQSFGLNLFKQCTTQSNINNPYFYDVYIKNNKNQWTEVAIQVPNKQYKYYKRFKPSHYTSMTMKFISVPPLEVPILAVQNLNNPQIKTSSQQQTINLTLLVPFIIFMVLILLLFFRNFYYYMKYNPEEPSDPYFYFKAVFFFILVGIKNFGVGLWIWLFGLTAYVFTFYKFQQTIYLMIPNFTTQYEKYYQPFIAIFYSQFVFVFFSLGYIIYNLGYNVDYFLIDWQKEKNIGKFDVGNQKKQVSVWRKVLLVNEFYQLAISRLIDMELISLIGLFFFKGLNWINLNETIPSTTNLSDQSTNQTNIVLSYFIITFVLFAAGVIQFLMRHFLRIWLPLPIQNFVDLCSLCNISLIIFDQGLHGYYIHGMNPLGQSEGNLTFIHQMMQKQAKTFGKSRAFKLDDPDQCQTFEVIFPPQIRQAFQIKYKNRYQQKLLGLALNTSVLAQPIPEGLKDEDYNEIQEINQTMVESFKYYLEGIKTSAMNVKDRTFFEKLISCPIDSELIGALPIFFKDLWFSFNNVLLNGHQFMFLINFINFVNAFYYATSNIYMALFITLIFSRLFIKNFAQIVVKRNISKNTMIDDKFFN